MTFSHVIIVDWSAAKGPKRGKDSIWIAETSARGSSAVNIATRREAEAFLMARLAQGLAEDHRILLGADFAFGAPSGFVQHLTGQPTARSLWAWLAERVKDAPGNLSNYRDIAADMNSHFIGDGPFWGNTQRQEIAGLPRLKPALPAGLRSHRTTDLVARGSGASPKTIWQLAGVGAVGAQVLTGLPMLHRLCEGFRKAVTVWPFEAPTSPVVMAEVYPSLLAAQVAALVRESGMVADEAQVRLLSQALSRLPTHAMADLFSDTDPTQEEGCILGARQPELLRASLT